MNECISAEHSPIKDSVQADIRLACLSVKDIIGQVDKLEALQDEIFFVHCLLPFFLSLHTASSSTNGWLGLKS